MLSTGAHMIGRETQNSKKGRKTDRLDMQRDDQGFGTGVAVLECLVVNHECAYAVQRLDKRAKGTGGV